MLISACGNGPTGPQTVSVTLDEFQVRIDADTVPAGTVTFHLANQGREKHEFVILRTDLAVAGLPTDTNANKVQEEATGVVHVDEYDGVGPGQHFDLTVDLKAGRYLLVCNYPGHAHEGMVATLVAT